MDGLILYSEQTGWFSAMARKIRYVQSELYKYKSVKNITERDKVGTNAMLIICGLFVQTCAWH